MKEHIHHFNLLLFFIPKSIVINALFLFRDYILTKKAKHPAVWNFVHAQRSRSFTSAAWSFLKRAAKSLEIKNNEYDDCTEKFLCLLFVLKRKIINHRT